MGLFNAEAGKIAGAELQVKLLTGGLRFEFPQRATTQTMALFNQRHLFKGFGIKQFGGVGALQLGRHGFDICRFGNAETAGADIQRRVTKATCVLPDGGQQVVLTLL